jgi:hypothetical protein
MKLWHPDFATPKTHPRSSVSLDLSNEFARRLEFGYIAQSHKIMAFAKNRALPQPDRIGTDSAFDVRGETVYGRNSGASTFPNYWEYTGRNFKAGPKTLYARFRWVGVDTPDDLQVSTIFGDTAVSTWGSSGLFFTIRNRVGGLAQVFAGHWSSWEAAGWADSDGVLHDGDWHDVCVVAPYTPSGLPRIFVDGVEAASYSNQAAGTGASVSTVDGIRIGSYYDNNLKRQLNIEIKHAYCFDEAFSAEQVEELRRSPYQLFKPAADIQPTALIPSVGTTITGTGALSIGGITVSSTGERSVTGSGALALGGTQIAATAERQITGQGALTTGPAQIAATGERSIIAAGALATGPAALSGSGSLAGNINGTGALSAGAAQLAASGERSVTGSATLAPGAPRIAGAGAVGGVIGGSGTLTIGGLTISAAGERTLVGSGALTTAGARLDGSGALAGNIAGSGGLTIGPVNIAATGERTLSSIGSLSVGAALLSGTALTGIVYFYSFPEDSQRGGTLISPTRGGTLSRYEV